MTPTYANKMTKRNILFLNDISPKIMNWFYIAIWKLLILEYLFIKKSKYCFEITIVKNIVITRLFLSYDKNNNTWFYYKNILCLYRINVLESFYFSSISEIIDRCNRSNNASCAVTSIIQIHWLKTIIVKTGRRKVLFQ